MPKKYQRLGGAAKAVREKHGPFPSLVDGGIWEIQEGAPQIERLEDRSIMSVPFAATDESRKLQLHELAHVKFSPVEYSGDIAHDSVNAAEDARIIKLLGDIDPEFKSLNSDVSTWSPDQVKALSEEFRSRNFDAIDGARLYASTMGYNAEQEMLTRILKTNDLGHIPSLVDELYEQHIGSKDHPEFDDSLAFASEIEELFTESGESSSDSEGNEGEGEQNGPKMTTVKSQAGDAGKNEDKSKGDSDGESKGESSETSMQGGSPSQSSPQSFKPLNPGGWNPLPKTSIKMELEMQELEDADLERFGHLLRSDYEVESGEMEIKKPRLTEKLPVKVEGRKRTPSDTGSVPRNWHRYLVDKQVFTQKRIRPNSGGTVLVDMSGSMSLSDRQVDEILTKWPAALVAAYSSDSRYQDNGILRILAKNGKRTTAANFRHGEGWHGGAGNVVDIPALKWLAKQKAPRIWISDGAVTGIGDSMAGNLILDAARIVNRGRIKRINNVHELLYEDGE